MPDRTYIPRQPPTFVDRVLHHPFEIFMGAWWSVCGVVLMLSLVWPELPTSPSIQELPPWLALSASGTIGLGGAAVLLGLLIPWDRVDKGWYIERIGLSTAGTGWLGYGGTVLGLYPQSIVSWSLGFTMAGAAALRFAATIVVEKRTRRAIAKRGV